METFELSKLKNKEKLINQILGLIESIKYGHIQIIIQDSKVVQIDKTEKIRLDSKGGDLKH